MVDRFGGQSVGSNFTFTNGQFKILQLVDIQLNDTGSAISAQTERAMRDAMLALQPDLVVFTGDQINNSSTDASECAAVINNIIQTGDYVATGAGVYTCENDERALVNINTSAKNSAGQVFQYWLDCDTGDIVSYSRGYAFYAIKNTTLRPVYGDTAVTAQPVIRISTVKYNSTAKKVNFYAERSVPGAYEVIQTGVVVTKTAAIGTDDTAFVLGASGTAKGTSINKASAGFYTGVVSIDAGETVWARGYLIYRDAAGDIYTVYSPITSYTR